MPNTNKTSNIPTAAPPPPPPMGNLSMSPPPPPGGGSLPTTPPPPTGTKPSPTTPKMKVVEKSDIKDGGGLVGPKLTNEKSNKDEKKEMEKKAKDMISSTGKPNGKKKKLVATILGVLFLVGAVGAGAILVQRNQDIREKASVCTSGQYKCVGKEITECVSGQWRPSKSCPSGQECSNKACRPVAGCTSGQYKCVGKEITECVSGQWRPSKSCPSGQECSSKACRPVAKKSDGTCLAPGEGSSDCKSGKSHFDKKCAVTETVCGEKSVTDPCTLKGGGRLSGNSFNGATVRNWESTCENAACGGTFKVFEFICPDGCGYQNASCTKREKNVTGSVKSGDYSLNISGCGTAQTDAGCWGTKDGGIINLGYINSTSCEGTCTTTQTTPPKPTSPPGIDTQCLNVKVYDTSWNQITDLNTLVPGMTIRLTVAGTVTSGTIDKARFTINGTLRPEVTGKRPGTSEFFDEYIIPANITTFTMDGELHHSSGAWF